ncbi:MAG: ABC transporter ATP-binding protein [Candidatus Bathyarchaeia archaeon]
MAGPAIECRALTKRFGQLTAVDGLDLTIARGEFYGLLGPNGAGKTTTLGLLCGLLRPSSGSLRLLGRDFDADAVWFKQRLGEVQEQPSLFSRLTSGEQLRFVARMHGYGCAETERRCRELAHLFRLEPAAGTPVADLSRGQRKKLALACALVHAPSLLFLDEPFEGLDALAAELVRQLLQGLCRRGATVVLTTHLLDLAQRLCSRVGIINGGKLVAQRQVEEAIEGGPSLREIYFQAVGEGERQLEIPSWLEPADDP